MNASADITDKEFRACFSLLPKVLELLKKLSNVQGDAQKQAQLIQATVDDLKAQMQRCRQVLECCAYLDQTPEIQQTTLSQKQDKLKQACDLLLQYKELDVLSKLSSLHSK